MSNAYQRIDRAGIFKARPHSWSVVTSERSKSIGVAVGFLIDAQLGENNEWESWAEYEPHTCYGTFYVVGREGKVNQTAVNQLVKSLGWDGNLASVVGDPPDVVVQITVKEEIYEGKAQFKASWMNPGDYVPTPFGASAADVKSAQAQFGSLLRAAAAEAKKDVPKTNGAPKPKAPAPAAQAPAPATKAPPRVRSAAAPAEAAAAPAGKSGTDEQFDDDIPF